MATEASRLYREMVRVRAFEELAMSAFREGHVAGSIHLCTGQEAIPVGVVSALSEDDQVCCTYRGHGYAIALGCSPAALLAEIMGRETGVCAGRASGMNAFDVEHRLIGCYAIVGAPVAAATGVALASKMRRDGAVAIGVVGDGAVNQAYFHESLNFAAIRNLPLVVVCENNLYGEYTPLAATTAGGNIAARAAGYGIPGIKVDGNDVFAVAEAAADAVRRARNGQGPTLLECETYRHYGHSRDDPGAYRPVEEVREWLARDPLPRVEALLPPSEVARTRDEVASEMDGARAAAMASGFAGLESVIGHTGAVPPPRETVGTS